MYVIVEANGHQYEVSDNTKIRVTNMEGEIGKSITLDKVLLVNDNDKIVIGNPYVEKAEVKAEIVNRGKGKKILIYKFKGRKKYRRKNGYRDRYVELLIKGITY
ncbi:MAG: 50S ribosomal protein L21 [Proteobacteria bacterium]|nr:50S ribosomal protein L21 [Pseudomonadota bacterium]